MELQQACWLGPSLCPSGFFLPARKGARRLAGLHLPPWVKRMLIHLHQVIVSSGAPTPLRCGCGKRARRRAKGRSQSSPGIRRSRWKSPSSPVSSTTLREHSTNLSCSADCILLIRVDLKEKDWINSHHRESAVTKYVFSILSSSFKSVDVTLIWFS